MWARVRDGVHHRQGELGRQVALALVSALQAVVARGERLHIFGGVREVFAQLGVARPDGRAWSAKASIAALQLVAELAGGAIQRVTGQRWRVVSSELDVVDHRQLELVFGDGLDPIGKAESAPGTSSTVSDPAPRPRPSLRARARSALLEQLFGREPIDRDARALARRVVTSGAVERGEAWAVSLTVPDGVDVIERAQALAAALTHRGLEFELVPERGAHGERLHYHGVCIAPRGSDLADLVLWAAGGRQWRVRRLGDVHRVRYWAAYCHKGVADDAPLLRYVAPEQPPTVPPRAGLVDRAQQRAREWLRGQLERWSPWGRGR